MSEIQLVHFSFDSTGRRDGQSAAEPLTAVPERHAERTVAPARRVRLGMPARLRGLAFATSAGTQRCDCPA